MVTRMLRMQSTRLLAITICLILFWLARQPEISTANRKQIADRFQFAQSELPNVNANFSSIRKVKPSLDRIAAWVSSTGAGVALNDLDNDGISNDVCLVDPRTNSIIVTPAPGTPARFQPFSLNAGTLYNPTTMAPMGCIPSDLNEDGLMDLLVPLWGRTPLLFLAVSATGKAQFRPAADSYKVQEIISGGQWFTGAATVADLDGDGHLDIVIGNYFPDESKILNTDAVERGNEMQHSMSRAFNAGRSRLLRWESATSGLTPSVKFREVVDYIGLANIDEKEKFTHGWTLAVAAIDINADLLPDLYFANDFGPDRLLLNQSRPGQLRFVPLVGTKTLTTPTSKVLGRDSFKGMGVDVGDIDGDGSLDMYVSNIAADYSLHESHFLFLNNGDLAGINKGVAPFTDQSESFGLSRSGWSWDVKMGDFDNDGVLEILQATGFVKGDVNRWPELQELALTNDQLLSNPANWPRFQAGDGLSDNSHNTFFVHASDGRFYDVAPDLALNRAQISRGIATADVNCDGRLDFAVANQWDTSFVFLNKSPTINGFVGLRLRLPVKPSTTDAVQIYNWNNSCQSPNDLLTRPAIGALVSVETPSSKKLVAQVDGGNGHSGKRSPDLQFGLGRIAPESKLTVHVRWRDRAGAIRASTLQISPGWNTIVLN